MLWKWHSHKNPENDLITRMDLVELDSTLDLNHDIVTDLVAVVADSEVSFLTAISGRSGELLWQQTVNASCSRIGSLSLIGYVIVEPLCIQQSGSFPHYPHFTSKFIRRIG